MAMLVAALLMFACCLASLASGHAFAYVSVLCSNDSMQLAKMAVLYESIRRSRSPYPLIVLAPSSVSLAPTHVQRYQIEAVASLPGPPSMCDTNVIHALCLTQYKSLVYMNSAHVVVENVDELFTRPSFSGLRSAISSYSGDDLSTDLFVIKPSLAVYEVFVQAVAADPDADLYSLANAYLASRTNQDGALSERLPATYGLPTRWHQFAIWKELEPSVRIWKYAGPVRPWDFWKSQREDWRSWCDPRAFYDWRHLYHTTVQPGVQAVDDKTWKRWQSVCSSPLSTHRMYTVDDQFSILVGTFDRVAYLPAWITHYLHSPLVAKIYVTWHNPLTRPEPSLARHPRVELLAPSYDSLNNRFNPPLSLRTRAVLIADEDVLVSIDDLHFLFQVWKESPNAQVGLFPRGSERLPNNTWQYMLGRRDDYSLMLTKLTMMSSDYLYLYACCLPLEVHQIVDAWTNCEDIAMSLMISGLSGSSPLAVLLPVIDYGAVSGISSKANHIERRSACLNHFIRFFDMDPLSRNIEVLQRYHATR